MVTTTKSQRWIDQPEALGARVRGWSRCLIGFDFDGTLAPIVDDPAQARMLAEARPALQKLAATQGTHVAVVSGRALDDVRQRVGVDALTYAGNHGIELSGPGYEDVPHMEVWRNDLERALATAARRLAEISGIVIENKRLSASIHYRRVHPRWYSDVESRIRELQHSVRGLEIRSGKMVWELRPRTERNKGWAVRRTCDRFNLPSAAVLYVGDDTTDEDVFRDFDAGMTVVVGDSRNSSAQFWLDAQGEIPGFLRWLVDARRN